MVEIICIHVFIWQQTLECGFWRKAVLGLTSGVHDAGRRGSHHSVLWMSQVSCERQGHLGTLGEFITLLDPQFLFLCSGAFVSTWQHVQGESVRKYG